MGAILRIWLVNNLIMEMSGTTLMVLPTSSPSRNSVRSLRYAMTVSLVEILWSPSPTGPHPNLCPPPRDYTTTIQVSGTLLSMLITTSLACQPWMTRHQDTHNNKCLMPWQCASSKTSLDSPQHGTSCPKFTGI